MSESGGGGGFDLGQLGKVMKQAQELGERMKRLQDELANRTTEATVGGGMVTARANGRLEIVGIEIDPRAVDPRDVEMLQDLVRAAVNQALAKAQQLAQQEMQRVTGLPPGALEGILGGGGGGGSR